MRKSLVIAIGIGFYILIGNTNYCEAQVDPKKAKQLFDKKNYAKALPMYQNLSESDPDNTFYHFCLGLCYSNSLAEKHKAIDQLEKAVADFDSFKNSSPEDAYYALGRAYHLAHRFDEAIETYETFKSHVQKDMEVEIKLLKERFALQGQGLTEQQFTYRFVTSDPVIQVFKELIIEANEQIKRCNFGKVLVSNPVDVIVENLGEMINSEYSEYGPVVSSDEGLIAFTRRDPRTTGGKISPDGDYYEDIYLTTIEQGSLFKNGGTDTVSSIGYIDIVGDMSFSLPKSISPQINTDGHEGAIQLSFKGDKLYFYKSSNVWTSTNVDGVWSDPVKVSGLEGIVNTKAFEPSLSISIEEDVIFIVSDRKGGKGGLDIYKSIKKIDGTWGPAVNLEDVNTPYDEDGPYTDPDGSTLYFSSKGHSSMGGYDIFKSQFKGAYWTRPPQNMGAPINSAADDIFYMMTPRYNRAYYSSAKPGGFGGMDIYRLTFANERNQLAEVKGLVLEGEKLVPAYSKITIMDDEYDTEISSHYSDSISGDYLLLLSHGKTYTMRVETHGFVPYVKKFIIPSQVYYYQFYQEVHHVHIRDKEGNIIGQKVTMHNAMFDIDKIVSPLLRPNMVPQKEILQLKANNLLDSYQYYITEIPELSPDSGSVESDSLYRRSAKVFESYQNLMTEFARTGAALDTSLAQGVIQEKAIEILREHEQLKRSIRELDADKPLQTSTDTARSRTMDVLDVYSDFVRNIAAYSPRTELSLEESAEYKDLDKTESYSKFIGSGLLNDKDLQYEEVTDIKFYISQDSLVNLMKEDPVVKEQVIEIMSNAEQEKAQGEPAETTSLDSNSVVESTVPKITKPKLDPTKEGYFSDVEIYFFEPEEEGTAREELTAYVLPKDLKKGTKPENEKTIFELVAEPSEPETNLYFINDFPGVGEDDVLLNDVRKREELEPFFEEADGAAKIIVLFGFNNNFFPASARNAFEWTAELINANPTMSFEVRGHTDSKGPMAYNMTLSGKRAQAIVNYFVKQGLDAERFTIVKKGESDPLLPNVQPNGDDNESGMRLNRRVEIIITSH